jgi:hypothetical protein
VSLRRYAQIVAVVFVALASAGFIFDAFFDHATFFGPGVWEDFMHLSVGLIFGYVGWGAREAATLRALIGGMGALLLVGKGMLIGGNLWIEGNIFNSVTEVVCLVVGLTSILAAIYLPGGAPEA